MRKKYIFLIILINVLAAFIVMTTSWIYVSRQNVGKLEAGKRGFDRNNEILTDVISRNIDEMYLTGLSWAHIIDVTDYLFDDAIEFIDHANTVEAITGNLIWCSNYNGYSTRKDASGNYLKITYEAIADQLFSMLDDNTVHITPRYVNPITGEDVVAFYHKVAVRDDDGILKDAILMRVVPISYLQDSWAFTMGSYKDVVSGLMEREGVYIVPPRTALTDNFFESMMIRTSDVTVGMLRTAVIDEDSVIGTSNSGTEFYFTFNNVAIHDDWVVMSYVPVSELIGEGYDWTVSSLIGIVMTILMAFDGVVLAQIRRKDKRTQEILTEQLETIRSQEEMLREALEMAQTANSAKSNFLSNMSHDIRTPMNAIVGLTIMLTRHAEEPDRVREYARKLNVSSHHLLSLINDVLDMSKIESGKTSLNIVEFSLAELVEEINDIIVPQAKDRGLTFEVSTKNIVNENVIGDKLKINQILVNMLSNSVKYTPAGGHVMLQINEMAQTKKNFGRYILIVQDSGIGISEEYRRHIFEPFTREEKDTVNKIQGTGLGMAITKSLVDLMGGLITVQSVVGQGTTFTVELELAIKQDAVDEKFWSDNGISNVLVVDDEEEVCTNIVGAMNGTGVSMQFALNGETAIVMTRKAISESRDFDVILIDWKMPGMDGIETARQIRRLIPESVPIVILTAYDWEDIEEEAREAGIDGFLNKPFFLSNFKESIRTVKGTPRAQEAGEDELDSMISGRRFLMAEDNEINAEILEEILDIHGAKVEIAENGRVAVEMFERAEPGYYDAVLMDIEMPVMNGLEATKAIRASVSPAAKHIPIIAMTANAFAEDVQASLDAGMNAHVAKPIDLNTLASALKKQLIDQTF